MQWYPWLGQAYRQLLSAYRDGKGHHALLLHSAPGNGSEALFYALSRYLMCSQPEGEKSCGHCHGCHLMLAGNHPDLYKLEAEKDKSSIGIEPVRKLIDSLNHHAQQGGSKVILLPRCEDLTEAASNALLKMVEEPPKNTYFLFGCETPEKVITTLRSRCFMLHLASPSAANSIAWIQREIAKAPESYDRNLTTWQMSSALSLSHGAPIEALSLLQNDRWTGREDLCRVLGDFNGQSDVLSLLNALNQSNATERLHWLSSLLLDAVKVQQGAATLIDNQDQSALVHHLAARFTLPALQAGIVQGWHCLSQINQITSVNKALLLTDFLLNWQSAVADITYQSDDWQL